MENQPIVKEFLELVQIDSPSHKERQMADCLTAKLKALGFTVEEDDAGQQSGGNAGNLFAWLDGQLPGSILFCAHMDRVPNGTGIKPQFQEDKIVSDGTTILAADDMAGVSAILDGVRRVLDSGEKRPRIEIIFTVAEEDRITGSRYLDYTRYQSKIGFALDTPGHLGRVNNGAPSSGRLKAEIFGKAAHAGNCPENGVNALAVAGKILGTIRQGRLDFESTSNFPTCVTNYGRESDTNVVCDYALIQGECRSRNEQKYQDYISYFQKFCQEAAREAGATVQTEAIQSYKGFAIPEDDEIIQIMEQVFQQMEIPILVEMGGGGMDANRLNEHGIKCVGLAIGYSGNHSTKEQIYIKDFVRSGEMVSKIIQVFASSLH